MPVDSFHEILCREGFSLIGALHQRFRLDVWWNSAPDRLLQVLVMNLGDRALLKGDKSYYLRSVTEQGETWARDLPALHEYLEDHFPELRLAFSHFRDVPKDLASKAAEQWLKGSAPTQSVGSIERLAELQQQLRRLQTDRTTTERLTSLLAGERDLLHTYVRQESQTQRQQSEELRHAVQRERERLDLWNNLQRHYHQKCSAAAYTFSISSNLEVVTTPSEFADALRAVVKDLTDQHRHHVQQKLTGGRLKIQVVECGEPAINWIEQWFGGALSPTQLQRLLATDDSFREASESQLMISPDEAIMIDAHMHQPPKLIAARVLSGVLGSLDSATNAVSDESLSPSRIPPHKMPLHLGHRVDDTGAVQGALAIPLSEMIHGYISGTTGAGKSFLTRIVVEEAARHLDLNILILDPRNQFSGLLVPEDRAEVLARYEQFNMKIADARGYAFGYFAPALRFARTLPEKLHDLAVGRNIVSFKHLTDAQRCERAARVLDAVFTRLTAGESDQPRLLIVLDESQLFTRRRVNETARSAAAEVERSLERIAREGRKYGIVLLLVSQTIKDFGYELATLRQMTNTKIFLRNSDRELEFAAEALTDPRQLVHLPTGTAMLHHAGWGLHRIQVRPPYSKVCEISDESLSAILQPSGGDMTGLTVEAASLLKVIRAHTAHSSQPLNLSLLANLSRINSRRRLYALVKQLETARIVRTIKLAEQGAPRLVQLT